MAKTKKRAGKKTAVRTAGRAVAKKRIQKKPAKKQTARAKKKAVARRGGRASGRAVTAIPQADLDKLFKHPIRVRICQWLTTHKPSTQREMGRAMSLATAAVHYHLKLLEKGGLVHLVKTRPGPKTITEKLYTVDAAAVRAAFGRKAGEASRKGGRGGNTDLADGSGRKKADGSGGSAGSGGSGGRVDDMLRMLRELQREGGELAKKAANENAMPNIAVGGVCVKAPQNAIRSLIHQLDRTVRRFTARHKGRRPKTHDCICIAYSILPASSTAGGCGVYKHTANA